jgi:pimeloyl-ACP methyl ester carboxylesterase
VTPTEQVIELRDGAVRFRVLSAGSGRPLVYFHSFHERGGWPVALDRLARRYRVHAPFHPGVAGSEGVETLDDLLDLILAYDELLRALGLERAHLCGHFFGGMVAAELAALFPGRADRLALISPLGLWLDAAPPADVIILPGEELHQALWHDPRSEAARRWATLPATDEENVAAQIESIQRLSAMARFVWPIPDKGIRKRLHRITAPTLLLWGDADRVNPVVYGQEWQRRVKGAEVRLVAGGHMVLHESPGAAADAIAAFLDGGAGT